MKHSFSIPGRYPDCHTPNAGPTVFPVFRVPVLIYDRDQRAFDPQPVRFLWDTGASFCMIDRRTADDFHIRIDPTLDRVDGGMEGLGGQQEAWLTTMRVQFPLLTATRRFLRFGSSKPASLAFDFTVLVVESLGVPLLGASDVLRNFTVTCRWEACHFHLNADHLGTPV
jgi:hypothetical protein